jgi:iron complex outermembrane receptor protein
MELVWEQYFANHFQLTVSGFYYPIRSLIIERMDSADGNAVFTNAGSLDLRGLELGLSRSLPGGLEGTVSYTFQDAISPNDQRPVTNSPKHLIQASVSVPVIKQKVFASMNLQDLSNRETLAGQYSGAYTITNFTLFSRNVIKGWEASASLYNAFNQKYADPGGNGLAEDVLFQNGRNFRIKVGYRY